MHRLPSEALVALDAVWAKFIGRTVDHGTAVSLAQSVRSRFSLAITNAEIETLLRDTLSPSQRAAQPARKSGHLAAVEPGEGRR